VLSKEWVRAQPPIEADQEEEEDSGPAPSPAAAAAGAADDEHDPQQGGEAEGEEEKRARRQRGLCVAQVRAALRAQLAAERRAGARAAREAAAAGALLRGSERVLAAVAYQQVGAVLWVIFGVLLASGGIDVFTEWNVMYINHHRCFQRPPRRPPRPTTTPWPLTRSSCPSCRPAARASEPTMAKRRSRIREG
jgi:hypothetical protein